MKSLVMAALVVCLSISAKDYETAQRFTEGDVVSADVLNDILDRIELTLKSVTTSDFVGSWDVTWKTCVNGGPGNCVAGEVELNVGDGWSSTVDNLYKTRSDTWTITDDGDGTFSFSVTNYCFSGAVNGVYFNDPCNGRVDIDSGIALFGLDSDSDHTVFFDAKRVSDSRFFLWQLKSGSNSFVVFTLDKKNLPPGAPTDLTASLATDCTSCSVSLGWTAISDAQSYEMRRKASLTSAYASLGTVTTNSYTDSSIVLNNRYWYRVFAIDADGTSNGSNVVGISYQNTPPYMNLSSAVSMNENTTAISNVSATDAEGHALAYSISSQSPGNDASLMSITSAGVLSFTSAPDYEDPSDYGTNNIYDITVNVSDGVDSVSQDVGVVVLNVANE